LETRWHVDHNQIEELVVSLADVLPKIATIAVDLGASGAFAYVEVSAENSGTAQKASIPGGVRES
jgi:hypothetical protein